MNASARENLGGDSYPRVFYGWRCIHFEPSGQLTTNEAAGVVNAPFQGCGHDSDCDGTVPVLRSPVLGDTK